MENPKENLDAGRDEERVEVAKKRVSPEDFSDAEKERIFEEAKRRDAWSPIAEGLRVGISKSKLILYAEEILAKKADTEGDEAVMNFKGTLERHGFMVSENEQGKFLVNIAPPAEKIPASPSEENAPKKEIRWASGLVEHLTEKEIKERFEQSKPEGPFTVIRVGTQLGISPETLTAYAKSEIAKKAESGNFAGAVNLLALADTHDVFVGTKEELDSAVREFYAESMLQENYDGAMECARLKGEWGMNSPEYKAALAGFKKKTQGEDWEEKEEKREKELEKWSAKISRGATIKDLFDVIYENGGNFEESDIFWSEIHDNFNDEVGEELLELESDPRGAGIKVIDFFKKHGYSKKDIEIFLPVKFKKEPRVEVREETMPSQAVERFEFKEGASDKFWEASVEDNYLVVRFGKIGTRGQITKKLFSSPEAALREKQKRVQEKIRKGYIPTPPNS